LNEGNLAEVKQACDQTITWQARWYSEIFLQHSRHKVRVWLIASLVDRLIGLLLVFASKKMIHSVRDEMTEFVMPLSKKTNDSLSRQDMQNIRGLHRKELAKRLC